MNQYLCVWKHLPQACQQETSLLNLLLFRSAERFANEQGPRLTQKRETHLLKHFAVFIVANIIRSQPSAGQCVGHIHRFFHPGSVETQNQKGLQRRPRVREVPLFAGVVHGSWRATCNGKQAKFLIVSYCVGESSISLSDSRQSIPGKNRYTKCDDILILWLLNFDVSSSIIFH